MGCVMKSRVSNGVVLSFLLFAASGVCPASATQWFVNANPVTGGAFTTMPGNDANSGSSNNSPFKTITRALQAAVPGDGIVVDIGIYTETVVITKDNISIIGVDSGSTVIDPPGDSSVPGLFGIFALQRTRLLIRDIGVRDAADGIGFFGVTSSRITRVRSSFNKGFGIFLSATGFFGSITSHDDTVDFCAIDHNSQGIGQNGSSLGSSVDQNEIRDNAADSNVLFGISIGQTSKNLLVRNTARFNGQVGIVITSSIFTPSLDNLVVDNQTFSNFQDGIRLQGAQNNIIQNNVTRSNLNAGIHLLASATGVTNGNVIVNNLVESNGNIGIALSDDFNRVYQNTVRSNQNFQISLAAPFSRPIGNNRVNKNNILPPLTNPLGGVGVFANPSDPLQTVDLTRNWWGTTDSQTIRNMSQGTLAPGPSIVVPFRPGPVDTSVGADTVAPAAPSAINAVSVGGQVRLDWPPVATNEEGVPSTSDLAGYKVYRNTASRPSQRTLMAVLDTHPFLVDTTPIVGQTYYYAVTAFDNHTPFLNESFYSQEIAVTVSSGGAFRYVNDTFTASDVFTTIAGSDTAGNGSPGAPFRTITKALSVADTRDVILIDAGFYDESAAIRADSISLIGVDSASTVIDPPDSPTNTNGISSTGHLGLLIRDLRVTDAPSAGDGILFTTVRSSVIRNVRADNNQNGIELQTTSLFNTITGVTATLNTTGILLTSSDTNVIMKNTAGANTTNGIFLNSNSDGNLVFDNTCDSNSGSGAIGFGIRLSANCDSNFVRNNRANSNKINGCFIATDASNNRIEQNSFESNLRYQIAVAAAARNNRIVKNNIRPSPAQPDSGVLIDTVVTSDFTRNWWNTTNRNAIRNRIFGSGAGSADFEPYRLGPVDIAVGADSVAPTPPGAIILDTSVIGRVKVSWTNPVSDEEGGPLTGFGGVRVYRVANFEDTPDWAPHLIHQSSSPSETFFFDTDIVDDFTYFYRLTSFDTWPIQNESFLSETVFTRVDTEPNLPPVLRILQVSSVGGRLEVQTELFDPDGDPVSGVVRIGKLDSTQITLDAGNNQQDDIEPPNFIYRGFDAGTRGVAGFLDNSQSFSFQPSQHFEFALGDGVGNPSTPFQDLGRFLAGIDLFSNDMTDSEIIVRSKDTMKMYSLDISFWTTGFNGFFNTSTKYLRTLFQDSIPQTPYANTVLPSTINLSLLAAGDTYTFRITATDGINRTVVADTIFTYTNESQTVFDTSPPLVTSIGVLPPSFQPLVDTPTISFDIQDNFPGNVFVTVQIRDTFGAFVRTLLFDDSRPQGPGQVKWDGRDDFGRFVPAGEYVAQVTPKDIAGNVGLSVGVGVVVTDTTSLSIQNIGFVPARFRPGVESTVLSYELTKQSLVTITLYDNNFNSIRILQPGTPTPAGLNSIVWDGKDAGGSLMPPDTVYLAAVNAVSGAQTATETATVNTDSRFTILISDLAHSLDPFSPATGQILAVQYKITAPTLRVDTVFLKIFNVYDTLVRQDTMLIIDTGPRQDTWNGLKNTGETAPEGIYRFEITAFAGPDRSNPKSGVVAVIDKNFAHFVSISPDGLVRITSRVPGLTVEQVPVPLQVAAQIRSAAIGAVESLVYQILPEGTTFNPPAPALLDVAYPLSEFGPKLDVLKSDSAGNLITLRSLADEPGAMIRAEMDSLSFIVLVPKVRKKVVDATPPVTTLSVGFPSAGDVVTSATSLELSAADDLSGVQSTNLSIDSSPFVTVSAPFRLTGADGFHTLQFFSVDGAGNAGQIQTKILLLDNTPPQIAVTTPRAGDGYANRRDTIVIDFAVGDNTDTSPTFVAFLTDLEEATRVDVFNGQRIDPLALDDGFWQLTVIAQDYVNNGSRLAVGPFRVVHDLLPPRTSLSVGTPRFFRALDSSTFVTSATTVSLAAVDDLLTAGDSAGLGVSTTEFRLDGGTFVSGTAFTIPPPDGQRTVGFRSADVVANVEPEQSVSIIVDNTPPATTLSVDITDTTGTILIPQSLISLSAMDGAPIPVGVDRIEYGLDGGPAQTYVSPFSLETPGSHTLSFQAFDLLGNAEPIHTLNFTVSPALSAAKSVSFSPRALVWLNGETTGFVSILKSILDSAPVLFYDIVERPDSFVSSMRTDSYNIYFIIGDKNHLEKERQWELAERVRLGDGLISSFLDEIDLPVKDHGEHDGDDKDNRASKNILGVDVDGKLSKDITVTLTGSAIAYAGDYQTTGRTKRVRALSPTAVGDGFVPPKGDDKAPAPTVVSNAFGRGKTVFFAFDMAQSATATNTAATDRLIRAAFAKATPTQEVFIPAGRMAIAMGVQSKVVPANLAIRIEEMFPADASVVNKLAGNVQSGVIVWNVALDVDETDTVQYVLGLPDISEDTVTTTADISYLVRGNYILFARLPLTVITEKSLSGLLDKAIRDLTALPVSDPDDREKIKDAIEDLDAQLRTPPTTPKQIETAIEDVLEAVRRLDGISANPQSVESIRETLDKIILIYGRLFGK